MNKYLLYVCVLCFLTTNSFSDDTTPNIEAENFYKSASKYMRNNGGVIKIETDSETISYSLKKNVDIDKGLADIKKAIEIDDKNSKYFVLLGELLRVCDQKEESILAYQNAIKINPKNAEAYLGIGLTYSYLGNEEEEIKNYKKCLELDNKNIPAAMNLAIHYEICNDDTNAIKYWSQCIEIDPKAALYYLHRGTAYSKTNAIMAIQDLSKAITLEKQGGHIAASAFWQRGLTYKIYFNDNFKALDDYNKAIQIDKSFLKKPYPNMEAFNYGENQLYFKIQI